MWYHFYYTLLFEAAKNIHTSSRGEDTDATTQWEKCQGNLKKNMSNAKYCSVFCNDRLEFTGFPELAFDWRREKTEMERHEGYCISRGRKGQS